MRYFVEIAYSGTRYHGWQEQKNARGIQQVISEALSLLLKAKIKVIGSGRTDTGVHAIQQVAQFDTHETFSEDDLTHHLNRFLPDDIAITGINRVDEKAHARFSALSRTYEYLISPVKDPFMVDRVWFLKKPLNLALLNEASEILLKHRDFESFSRVKTDVNHFRCNVDHASWSVRGKIIVFTIRSDRFLRGMVRAIVGTMVDISRGKIALQDLRHIIRQKDRRLAGPAAPAEGLYLVKVEYPADIFVKLQFDETHGTGKHKR